MLQRLQHLTDLPRLDSQDSLRDQRKVVELAEHVNWRYLLFAIELSKVARLLYFAWSLALLTSPLVARTGPFALPDMGSKDKKKGKKDKRVASTSSASGDISAANPMLNDSESGESDMFPGGVDLGPERQGKPHTGTAKKGAAAKKTESAGTRRSDKETYKSQRVYRDFVNHHVCVWLDEVDPTYLNMDVYKDERRAKLFSTLAFCFGWLPGDSKIATDKAGIVRAASGQYARRNKPAERTGWGPSEIHSYMKWQLEQFRLGRIKRDAVGGFSWSLPERDSKTGAPAPLPAEVVEFAGKASTKSTSKKKKGKKRSRSSSSSSSQESEKETDANETVAPTDAYTLKLRDDGSAKLTQQLGYIIRMVH